MRVRRTAKRWFPLYQYRDARMARVIFKHLIGMDELPPDLASLNIEDFRIVVPDPRAEFEYHRKQARKARRKGGETLRVRNPRVRLTRPAKRRTAAPVRLSERAVKVGTAVQ